MPMMRKVIPESEIRVRLESVRIGQWLTFIVCGGAQIYALATWDQPYRGLMTQGIGTDSGGVNLSIALANRGKRSCSAFSPKS